MQTHQAFRFALDPNDTQRCGLAAHAGAARFAFNWGLALVKDRLEVRKLDASVEIPWNLPALRRQWNRAKHNVAPWWAKNSKEAYSSGLDGLAGALGGLSDSKSAKRKGRRIGFPRFRKRRHCRATWRFTTGAIAVVDDRHIRLPRIGVVRTAESTIKLATKLDAPSARVLSATISEQAGRWFVSFTCETERDDRRPNGDGDVVGVDVGVSHLAVVAGADAEPTFTANPRPLITNRRKMTRLQRELSRRKPGSKRRAGTKARLAVCHRRIAAVRRDSMHKLTTDLAKTHGTIVVENLAVANMTTRAKDKGRAAKAGLNRAILDAGFAELRGQLAYKCTWYGCRLVVVERTFPSSKTCSDCGERKPSLSLSVRVFECNTCGLVIDRDHNAARNLAKVAVAASATETRNGRGDNLRPGLVQAHLSEASTEQPVLAGISLGALEPDSRFSK